MLCRFSKVLYDLSAASLLSQDVVLSVSFTIILCTFEHFVIIHLVSGFRICLVCCLKPEIVNRQAPLKRKLRAPKTRIKSSNLPAFIIELTVVVNSLVELR